MKIYITPFITPPDAPPVATGPSTDSGFASFDEVTALMGPPARRPAPSVLIYGDVCFTPIALRGPDEPH